MTPQEKLKNLENHAFYRKYFAKLKKADVEYMNEFFNELLKDNDPVGTIIRSATRKNKSKNWTMVEELLSIAFKK